jgi:two-component system cell cycle response regulator
MKLEMKVGIMERSERNYSTEILEDKLSAAIIADDNELDRLLREAAHITESLKSTTRSAEALGHVLRRAIQCAVKQSILDRELRSLALTDELTGLHNRRGFLALARQQLKVADRNNEGALLFFADIDNLKEINDHYSHREGDITMIRAADALRHTFRDSDIISRLGGDEFAILALETSSRHQETILRRLSENLEKLNAGEARLTLALSVGVARFDPEHPISLSDLLSLADRDMYKHKTMQTTKVSAVGATG